MIRFLNFRSYPADKIIAETKEQSDTSVWVTFRGERLLITVQFAMNSSAWFHPANRFPCLSERDNNPSGSIHLPFPPSALSVTSRGSKGTNT